QGKWWPDVLVGQVGTLDQKLRPPNKSRDFLLSTFKERLAKGDVIVIDGGMALELERRGAPRQPSACWAAVAVLDRYETVRMTHEDYIRAGADVIITNTFMASQHALDAAGIGDRMAEVNRRSVEAAREARENAADRSVLIAGALFPGFLGPDRFVYPGS